MKKLLLTGLACALLVGCVGTPFSPIEYTMKNKFDVKQAEKQMKAGTGKIEGTAFLRQNGGGVVTCAGAKVNLVPYTDYTNEAMTLLYGNSEKGYRNGFGPQYKVINEDENFIKYVKSTICDAQGKFIFENLSAGTYFVGTEVVWSVGYSRQGGKLMQKVVIGKGEIQNIIMSY
ncbi:carboxypeptidase-like regulatory domain-containing protein [Rodentibacter pneumotropicus]|uniref:carboxypeptidase-like regulatory domain-containing protein n=1 Tax=Rodentibacter pneumotropicus TaxID=758 RepID=UPI00109D2BAB|nr:carboxypeptidase-like regulatory domain-containing protein [Rodentibacter pneumotropicus]